jgi:hypothetical protein
MRHTIAPPSSRSKSIKRRSARLTTLSHKQLRSECGLVAAAVSSCRSMPLGFIHLISADTETGAGAIYYCGIGDAIAAINPARLDGFPREMICPECMRAYGEQGESDIE